MATKRQNPAAIAQVRVGGFRAPVDLQGMDPAMKKTLLEGDRPTPIIPSPGGDSGGGNTMAKMRQGVKNMGTAFSRLMGKREHTPAEEESFKNQGDKAYWDAKYQRSLGRK